MPLCLRDVTICPAESFADTVAPSRYYQPSAPINTDTSGAGTASEDVETTQMPSVTSNIASSKISSPDTALTAFCQLVTWRTGSERAMIRHALDEPHSIVDVLIQHSLIDSSTQYFIAESTKTVDLVDNTSHAPGDEIWIGCDNVSKAGRLCERTIEVAPTGDSYPCFIVKYVLSNFILCASWKVLLSSAFMERDGFSV